MDKVRSRQLTRANVIQQGLVVLLLGAVGYYAFRTIGFDETSSGIAAEAVLILIVIGWLLTPIFARVVTIRQALLVPCILVICLMGVYVYRGNLGDIQLALIVGVFGYLLRKVDIPIAPLVIAFIITPIAERSMKQALILSDGDFTVFIMRPISAAFLLLAALWYLVLRGKETTPKFKINIVVN